MTILLALALICAFASGVLVGGIVGAAYVLRNG